MQPEKKKLIIVAALAVACVLVGAFEFKGGSKAPAPAKKASKSTKNLVASNSGFVVQGQGSATSSQPDNGKTEAPVIKEPDLGERDPFDGSRWIPVDPRTRPTPPPPPAAPPKALKGALPVQPDVSQLPAIGPDGKPLPTLASPVKPQAPDRPDYFPVGVITGDRPAAIFADSRGDQRLVQLGGSLDSDTKVVAISRGKVTVRFHTKDITMTVGANNPTEKRSDEK